MRQVVSPTTFLYWFQVIYGAALGVAGFFLVQRSRAGTYGAPFVLTIVGLVFLSLIFFIYLQNLNKRPLTPDYSLQCYSCKLPVNRFSEFCEHCGADLVERKRIGECPSCQEGVYEGVAFCPSCGEDLRVKKIKKVRYG